MNIDVLIVGAGISGLSVAYALKGAGLDVLLVEANSRVGGNIASERTATGFLLEHGPNTVASRSPELWEHFDELDIGSALEATGTAGARRYLLHNGMPVALPSSPPTAISTPLLSLGAKLRILAEPLLPSAPRDESIGAFFARRIGAAPAQTLVDAFVSGVYGGDPAALSMRAAFPRLWELEQQHGSLLRGILAGGGKRKAGKRPAGKRKIFSFRDGLATWPQALAYALGDGLWLNAPITGLEQTGDGWRATVMRDGTTTEVYAEQVVLAVPAHVAVDLLDDKPARDVLQTIPYASMAVVHLGYRREDVAHPLDGFGLLCPSVEGRAVLGSLWPATLFPGRAPKGHVLTTNFIGGARHPEYVQQDEESLIELVHNDLRAMLGVRGEPVLARVIRWPRAIPQYVAGHTERMAAVENLEATRVGLHLLANYRGGVGVEACWLNAQQLAGRIKEWSTTSAKISVHISDERR